jgi:hypothetical protein
VWIPGDVKAWPVAWRWDSLFQGRTVHVPLQEVAVPFVKCSVDGCNRKLQPLLKVDPRDRDTWFYREYDVCFKPACEKHSSEVEDRIICDRGRRESNAQQRPSGLIDLGFRLPSESK